MNEKGIPGRGNSRSKERKWSVKRWARKGQGGKNQKEKHPENAQSEWRETGRAQSFRAVWQESGRTLALWEQILGPWLYIYEPQGRGFVLQWWQQLISINSASQLFSAFSNSKFYQAPQFWVLLSVAQLLTLRSHRKGKPTRGGQRQGISTVPQSPTFFRPPSALYKGIITSWWTLLLPLFCYYHYSYIHFIQSLLSVYVKQGSGIQFLI